MVWSVFSSSLSFFHFGQCNGTRLVVRVILQTSRASVFHVNHPGVDRDGVLHQPPLQERVNGMQSCQSTRRQHQVNRSLPLIRLHQALI